jgi:hypothetical protein
LLACAAASGRVAYVFLSNGQLKDWRVSEHAARSPQDAAELCQRWINDLTPDVLVTERTGPGCRKGDRVQAIIRAIAGVGEQNYVLDVSVPSKHDYANKYEEAAALAERYAAIKSWLPKKRRFFDNEPRNIVLFEALSLGEKVLNAPTTTLAAAMG